MNGHETEGMTPLNIGLLAHVDAGKTTLSEALLYECGQIRKMGRVDHQDSFLDHDIQERERGITIFSKLANLTIDQMPVTLIDTPGHVDFSTEMERTLQVLDACILIISGSDGVQSHTRTLWELMETYKLPVVIFVNKMDLAGVSESNLMQELRGVLHDHCLVWDAEKWKCEDPDFLEEIAVCDESLMEEFLEEGSLKEASVRSAIQNRALFPVFFGSALKGDGVPAFVHSLSRLLKVREYPKQETAARVYKIARDERGTRLTFLKVTGGSLKAKMQLEQGKIDELRIYSGRRYENVQEVSGGRICAVTGLEGTYPGQGLGKEENAEPPVLTSFLTYKVEILDQTDIHRVLTCLRELEEEDPQLHVLYDEESNSVHLQLMGAVQLEVISRLVYDRFHFQIRFGKGEILYRETIQWPVEGVGHYEPLRHYAEVHLLLEPLEPGSGMQFDTNCSEEVLSQNFQRLVLTHLEEKEHKGVLTGSPITDMKITLVSGRAHEKHTEGGDFRQSTYRAVRQGLMQAENVLLEPYIHFELQVPSDAVGRAMNDLTSREASFEMKEAHASGSDASMLIGSGPAETLQDYALEVASYTRGNGRFRYRFDCYRPARNAEAIIEQKRYDPEADLANTPHSVFCSHGAGMVVPWNLVENYMHLPPYPVPKHPASTEDASSPYRWNFNQWVREDTNEEEENVPVQQKERKPGSGGLGTISASDQELMEIFERTYGSATRKEFEKVRKPSYQKRENRKAAKTEDNREHVEVRLPDDKETYLLIDGYNIIHAWPDLLNASSLSYEIAREKLKEMIANYQGYTRQHCIIVYDAYRVKGGTERVIQENNISIVFTKEAETADTYIERASYELHRKHFTVRVATSDGPEQMIVMGNGAMRVSALELLDEVQDVNAKIHETLLHQNSLRSTNSMSAAFRKESD